MNTSVCNESKAFKSSLNASVIRGIINDHFQRFTYENETVSLILVGLYVPVLFLGIFGNVFLALIILTKSPLRNVTNLFLCSVALADLTGERTTIESRGAIYFGFEEQLLGVAKLPLLSYVLLYMTRCPICRPYATFVNCSQFPLQIQLQVQLQIH